MTNSTYNFIAASHTVDRKLYKYYSNTAYAIDSIKNKRIHLDNPRNFNDPFEAAFCCYHYSRQQIIDTKKNIVAKIHKYISRSYQNAKHNEIFSTMMQYVINVQWRTEEKQTISSVVEQIYSEFGEVDFSFDDFCNIIDQGFLLVDPFLHVDCKISCFSEVKDSILMWSYYAQSHGGVCVEYDLTKLNDNTHLNNQIIKNLSKVQYSPIRVDNLYSEPNEPYFNFLTSKSDVWSHEHEWRVICETEEEYLPFDCISSVYLGAKFNTASAKYHKLIKAVDVYDSLKVYKCKLNSEEYKIDFEEIYDSEFGDLFRRNIELSLNTKKSHSKIG